MSVQVSTVMAGPEPAADARQQALRALALFSHGDGGDRVRSEECSARRWLVSLLIYHGLTLSLNVPHTRLCPTASGIDFLGYVSYPGYRLVRRKVVGNLRSKLAAPEKRAVTVVTAEISTGRKEEPCSDSSLQSPIFSQ